MSPSELSESFCFMDLPPELRVSVYTYAFEDRSDALVELGAIRNHLPSTSLTAVSRLVRKECLPHFEEAYTNFWNDHMIHITAWVSADVVGRRYLRDARAWSKKHKAAIEKLPAPRGLVDRLAFQIGPAQSLSMRDSVSQVTAEKDHEGEIRFSSDTETDIGLIVAATGDSPEFVRLVWADDSVTQAQRCTDAYSENQRRDQEQALDVKACVRAVLKLIES